MTGRVYIAGPMSGIPAYNFPLFEKATRHLRDLGWEVVSPHEITEDLWWEVKGVRFNPEIDKAEWGDPIVREMLKRDLTAVTDCTHLVLLPGWEQSKGAKIELALARALKLTVFLFPSGLALPENDQSAPTETILQEAQRLVHGDRGKDYGHPIEDYTRTGRIWGAILGIGDIDPRICCLMMGGVKMSREVNKHKRDNLTDLAGYAECADMIAQKQGLK